MAKEINQRCLLKLASENKETYRCIAKHKVTGLGRHPNLNELEQYFKFNNVQDYGATYVDLAIGSRVRCTHNLATELGEIFEIS